MQSMDISDVFTFYLQLVQDYFWFLGTLEIFSGLSVLHFLIAFVVLLIIVDNFILKPGKHSGTGGKLHRSSGKHSEGK